MIRVENVVLGMCATNCYAVFESGSMMPGGELVDELRDAVIIDPAADVYSIRDMINKYKLNPVAILLTHGHFDHWLAADALRKMYNIKVYAAQEEQAILENSTNNLSLPFTGSGDTLVADEYFAAGSVLNLGRFTIKTLLVPGHTVGGTCYYFEKEQVLISGDTLFAGSVGRSDFPTGSASALIRNIKIQLLSLPENVKVFPGHGDMTTIGYEKVNNPFF